jgi:CubicO group peptidase (beta-lactamase class C family)
MAAAGLWTTPNDLALFLIELQRSMRGESNKVLTTEMVQKMMSPVVVGSYGLGLEIYQVSAENYFGHSGANEGFRCLMIAHNSGVGLVVMTNSDNGSKLNDKIFDLIATKENWPGAL